MIDFKGHKLVLQIDISIWNRKSRGMPWNLRGILSIFDEMHDFKCYYNFKAYISYPVPRAHKSKTYKYIYDSEIHAFNYNN